MNPILVACIIAIGIVVAYHVIKWFLDWLDGR